MIPGFVIVGVDMGDGLVTILASDELTSSMLSHVRLGERTRSRVDVEMRGYTVAKGATFLEAMSNLASHWQPNERTTNRGELGEGVRGLPAGDGR